MSRRRILTISLAVYGSLAAAAFAWAAYRGRPWLFEHPDPWVAWVGWSAPWRHAASVAGGAALALLTLAASRSWVRRYRWARELHVGFREVLGGADTLTIAGLALSSGIGEEVFFRGGLQPSVGWLVASVIFGLVHVGPDRRFWVWTPWALAMGLVLGALFEATGSLYGPILAHVWINYENLHFIVAHDPREPGSDDGPGDDGPPRLVGRTERR